MAIASPARRPGPPQGTGHYSADGTAWFDDRARMWLPVGTGADELTIELEDHPGPRRWWGALLTVLASPQGVAYSHFVARARSSDPRWPEYETASATFPRVRSLPDTMAPEEAWAPGMGEALRGLRAELESMGWRAAGRGERPWAYAYVRPQVVWPPASDNPAGP